MQRIKSRKVIQPIITQSELNKIDRHSKKMQRQKAFLPWTTVRQSHTHGQGQILTSHKADHDVHLLSIGELGAFLELEHNPLVVAIYEQFPLDITETIAIAEEMNTVHPGNYKERNKHGRKIPAKTMTTDLVALVKDSSGRKSLSPYSFKYRSSLNLLETSDRVVKRTEDKLAIEIEYWNRKKSPLRIVSEDFYCEIKNYNLLYFRECFDYPDLIDTKSPIYTAVVLAFKRSFKAGTDQCLTFHINTVAADIGIDLFHAECIFKHAAFHYAFPIDLGQKVEWHLPLPFEYKVNPYAY